MLHVHTVAFNPPFCRSNWILSADLCGGVGGGRGRGRGRKTGEPREEPSQEGRDRTNNKLKRLKIQGPVLKPGPHC